MIIQSCFLFSFCHLINYSCQMTHKHWFFSVKGLVKHIFCFLKLLFHCLIHRDCTCNDSAKMHPCWIALHSVHYKETALVLDKYMLLFPVLYSYNMHLLRHIQHISPGSAHIHHCTLARALLCLWASTFWSKVTNTQMSWLFIAIKSITILSSLLLFFSCIGFLQVSTHPLLFTTSWD